MVAEYIRMAFSGIWAHKLRSVLTMLGIIIGIASIIAISSTIMGINEQIKQNLIGAGNNAVTVKLYQGDMEYSMDYMPIPDGVPIYDEEVLNEVCDIPEVKSASFFHQRSTYGSISYGGTTLEGGMLYGIDNNYLDVYGYELRSGRCIVDADYSEFKKIALIDENVAGNLFPSASPLGEIIEIMGEPFVVVGVVGQKSDFKPTITSMDDYYMYTDFSGGSVFIPDAVWPVICAYDEPPCLAVRASSTESMTSAGNKAKDILNARITSDSVQYKSEDMLEQAKQLQDISNATNSQLIWIASISLLVGGIGVMNIMLVSVTERTREIGLKKALGAKRKAILAQFLIEAGVLTCIGGVAGVLAGIVLALIVSGISGVPIMISAPIALMAVVFSFIIGMFFGAFPAAKAAKLNPIEALRRE